MTWGRMVDEFPDQCHFINERGDRCARIGYYNHAGLCTQHYGKVVKCFQVELETTQEWLRGRR